MSLLARDYLKNVGASALRWLPALVPPLLIFLWMREGLVNAPFMDDYVWLPLYQKLNDGSFKWGDLMFVQMEHRLTVPAFLAWACYHLKPGQITLHNWISFAQLCLIGCNLIFILRRTIPGPQPRWVLITVGSLALFSPTQYSTLLWGDCISSYLAPLFITSAIALLLSGIPVWIRFVLCVVLAVLSSISYGSGLLVWPLLVPLILWTDAVRDRRQRLVFLALWLLACVVTMKLYFLHLENQAQPLFSYEQGGGKTFGVHLKEFMVDPWLDLKFILIFGGAMLGRATYAPMLAATLVAGFALAIALAACCVPLFVGKDRFALRSQTLPWIIIGLYSFAMGGMVAMSRIYAVAGLMGAPLSRYTVHSIFIVVALLVLGFFWWRRMIDSGLGGWRKKLTAAAPVVLGLLLMQLLVGWIYGAQMMEAWCSSRLRDATCQLFQKAVPRSAIQGPLMKTQDLALQMNDLGLLHPAMPRDNRLDHFSERPQVKEGSAKLETLEALPQGRFSATGIAFGRGQSRPADGILLCYKNEGGDWRIFAVAQVKQPPLFLRDALCYADMQFLHAPRPGLKQTFYGQWEIEFKSDDLPKGMHEVAAWTFDYKGQSVARMAGTFRVDGENMTVEKIEKVEMLSIKK